MKKLYLMRHATSNWPENIATDIQRPLTPKGAQEADQMGRILHSKAESIDLMMVSAAVRTQETAKVLKQYVKIQKSLTSEEIYETTHEHLLKVILSTPVEVESLLLLAHNPSISMLTTLFLGTYADLPPAVLVEIHFDVDKWNDIDRSSITYDCITVPSSI